MNSNVMNGQSLMSGEIVFDDDIVQRLKVKYATNEVEAMCSYARSVVGNYLTSRQQWLQDRMDHNGLRNINKECGYPDNPTANDYYNLYRRDPIASRVVDILPRECWQVSPEVYESVDEGEITQFEKEWKNLAKSLKGRRSWIKSDEEVNPIWEICQKVDEASGIGHYGIIFLGFNDITEGRSLNLPVRGMEQYESPSSIGLDYNIPYTIQNPNPLANPGSQSPFGTKPDGPGNKLMFMRVFPSVLAQIATWEQNQYHPRHGYPKMYNVTFNDPKDSGATTASFTQATQMVHWTRVIHVADNTISNPSIGIPRMEQVLNRILDLEKEYSSTAEGVWQQAFPTLSLETHQQLGGQVKVNEQSIKDMMELVRNGMQKYMVLKGMSANQLSPSVTDPTSFIDKGIEAICIKIPCPMRIFKGSERGELSSDQDDESWNDVLKGRENNHCTPNIISPLVDRLIETKCLSEPQSGSYFVKWPDLTSRSKSEKATTALNITKAMAEFVSGGCNDIMGLTNFYTKVVGFTQAEANEIVSDVKGIDDPTDDPLDESDLGLDDTPPTDPLTDAPNDPNKPDPSPTNPQPTKGTFPPGSPIGKQPNATNPPSFKLSNEGDTDSINDVDNIFCPTGKGGGVDSTCSPVGSGSSKDDESKPKSDKEPTKEGVPQKEMSEKAKRALESMKLIGASVQRYAEEHNEPELAKAIGGEPEPDNKPYDVLVRGTATKNQPEGKPKHGVEMKTMVDNKNNKLTMSSSAQQRKIEWEKETGATFHTVVYDDQKVFNANGEGKHDETKRVIYYRRGGGSFRVGGMHVVKDHEELVKLMNTPTSKLPQAAQPSEQWKQKQEEAAKS